MSSAADISDWGRLEVYEQQAETLFGELKLPGESAYWRFKWSHPSFCRRSLAEVKAANFDMDDARLVIVQENGFESWAELTRFIDTVTNDGTVAQFEAAAEAVISGDIAALERLLSVEPELVRMRSTRRHRATLLHYVAANGVESWRQKTPGNLVDIARTLLRAGADVDALAHMYGTWCSTLSLLVSSCHPAKAGVQTQLAETLLDHGASLETRVQGGLSVLRTALAFGYLETAEALYRRRNGWDDLPTVAGLGRVEETAGLLPLADSLSRHTALALAAQHGHAAVVRLLLDAGEDPNRSNPEGYHPHSTPLHQAALSGHAEVVRLLVERGAGLDVQDNVYGGTPLDWAVHGQQTEVADYLRERVGGGRR